MKKVIVLLCTLFCCQFITAQNAQRDTVTLNQATSSQVTKPEKRKHSEFILMVMVMSFESDYDVICDDDHEGHIVAMRNGKHLKVDIVTGEETPAPDYDKGKCPSCAKNKKTKVKPNYDSESDYFVFRWE